MPSWLGAPELIIVLIIVILIFGVGRIANIGGELGKGISAFRKGLKADEENKPEEEKKPDEEQKKE
jgi:sec-independent protein translocase protein TatA